MPEKIIASVLVSEERLELEEFPWPKLGEDDGLLRVEVSGICGADIEQFRGDHARRGVPYPVIPGHEPVGLIEEVGERAAARWGVRRGDRVVVEPIIPCGHCRYCRVGKFSMCLGAGRGRLAYSQISTVVSPGIWGGYGRFMYLHPDSRLHRVDASVAPEIASLFNPLANGLSWAAFTPATRIGDTVVILGSGQRGLACVMAAVLSGAQCIIVSDLSSARKKLELAHELGAHYTVEADRDDVAQRVAEITRGTLADVVVDTSSNATKPITEAIDSAAKGGTVILGGLKGGQTVPDFVSDRIVRKQLTVKGVSGAANSTAFEAAVKLIESGRFPLEKLHTHDFGLAYAEQAIRTLAHETPGEDPIHIGIWPWR